MYSKPKRARRGVKVTEMSVTMREYEHLITEKRCSVCGEWKDISIVTGTILDGETKAVCNSCYVTHNEHELIRGFVYTIKVI